MFGAEPVKFIRLPITLLLPSVHCPSGSWFSNNVNKSKAEGKLASQKDAGLNAVPDVNVS